MSDPALRLYFLPEAEDDFESLWRYGAETWGLEQAERYGTRILDLIDSLTIYPRLGRLQEDVAGETRLMAIGQHRILYRVESDRLVVVRIVHERSGEIADLG